SLLFFSLLLRLPPPTSTLFPYTTLFRSHTYDFMFIDCPPALSWLTLNAFTASETVIVVVSPGYFELDSIVQLNKTIEEVKEFFRSEEHTSELQSQSNLVCRLLLEKKKKK